MKLEDLKRGMRISWVPFGKIARLDGVYGKRVQGRFVEANPDGTLWVVKDYKSLVENASIELEHNKVQIVT